jgi:Skp family chaperone for outer membrane proteins
MKEENKNQKKFLILSIILSLLLVLSLVNIWLYVASTKKVVYVDTTLLYENFQGKKELEAQFSAFVGKQEKILDSLKLDIDKKYDEYQLNKSKEVETAIILKEKKLRAPQSRIYQSITRATKQIYG